MSAGNLSFTNEIDFVMIFSALESSRQLWLCCHRLSKMSVGKSSTAEEKKKKKSRQISSIFPPFLNLIRPNHNVKGRKVSNRIGKTRNNGEGRVPLRCRVGGLTAASPPAWPEMGQCQNILVLVSWRVGKAGGGGYEGLGDEG